ncbi:MAG: glycosyltransferase family 2 protein [Ignavibacteriales bacterium]|nr:glycosyltransferase family 2 protein [Ignavibacteriales bacterium]
MRAIEIILWCSTGIVLYTYCIYPIIVFVISLFKKRVNSFENKEYLPTVSVVISVYNEENILSEKFNNIFLLDYPKDKIEFIFGSDGSNDKTNSILSGISVSNIKVEKFQKRTGKANVLNKLIPGANGEIIVFSDANTMYDKLSIRKLVKHFQDPSIGGVCGELRLQINKKSVGEIGETSYWQYESILKKLESRYQTLLGATGGVYAIRKSLFKPLPVSKAIVDDFLIPMEVVRRGYRILYEPEAIAYEDSAGTVIGEFHRKVRIGASNFNGISEFIDLLNPKYGFIAFGLWSHKIIRWFAPFFLLAILILSLILALKSEFYGLLFYIQIVFMLTGAIGFLFEKKKTGLGILGFPYYFIAMNLALFIGFFKSVMGLQRSTWDIKR